MQLFILLQDHEGVLHKKFKLKLDDQTTMEKFNEEIHQKWKIEEGDQELYFFDGREVFDFESDSTLSQIGLKHRDKVVVKHSKLVHWKAYVANVEQFKEEQKDKQTYAEKALENYNMLLNSSFFVTYSEFDIKAIQLHPVISNFLDKRKTSIKNAAMNFFKLVKFRGENPVIEVEKTKDGSHSAVICNVKVKSAIHKYRIKTNHDAGGSTQTVPYNLDLVELFCYKFLESIGVGARVLFIPNCISSEAIIYIGSEWLPEFRSFSLLDSQPSNPAEISRVLVQIHFLAAYLSLGDMHDENIGIENNCNPIIVDFMMSNYADPKEKFLHKTNTFWNLNYAYNELLDNCTPTERLQIAKDSIQKWDFVKKLDETLKLMDKEEVDFD